MKKTILNRDKQNSFRTLFSLSQCMGYKFALFVLEPFLHLKQGTASNEHLKMDAHKLAQLNKKRDGLPSVMPWKALQKMTAIPDCNS